jgi:hypothetical protein
LFVPSAARLCNAPGTSFRGFACGDQASPALATLDHHQHLDERSENPIAQREAECIRTGAGRPLGDQRSASGDVFPQPTVLRRVRPIGTGADDRHRPSLVDGERAAVCGAVDALGQAGDDHHALCRQLVAELRSRLASVLRGVARAHDAHPSTVEHAEIATNEERGRSARIVE